MGVRVNVGEAVCVEVAVEVAVAVGVNVGVPVNVGVRVKVAVAVRVLVAVGVLVAVTVEVGVLVDVGVKVGVGVLVNLFGVGVAVGVDVIRKIQGKRMNGFGVSVLVGSPGLSCVGVSEAYSASMSSVTNGNEKMLTLKDTRFVRIHNGLFPTSTQTHVPSLLIPSTVSLSPSETASTLAEKMKGSLYRLDRTRTIAKNSSEVCPLDPVTGIMAISAVAVLLGIAITIVSCFDGSLIAVIFGSIRSRVMTPAKEEIRLIRASNSRMSSFLMLGMG